MSLVDEPWNDPPLPYTEFASQTTDRVVATHAVRTLNPECSPSFQTVLPVEAQCLVHLKLLECFNRLREDIGSADGLFGIRDELISPGLNDQAKSELLAKLCEMRWQIYVMRACLCFQLYWRTLEPNAKMLVEDNLKADNYSRIASHCQPIDFTVDTLPPLGKSPP